MIKRKKKIRNTYSTPYWKNLSGFSLALIYAKAYDNVLDYKSIKSKVQFALTKIIVRKAKKENRELFLLMRSSMEKLKENENNKCGFVKQSELFSETICSALDTYVLKDVNFTSEVNETCLKLVKAIVRWMCFIDAIDDYNEDLKDNKYNPIYCELESSFFLSQMHYKNKNFLFNYFWKEVLALYNDIQNDILLALDKYNDANKSEKNIICKMIFEIMPEKVFEIARRDIYGEHIIKKISKSGRE